jgi:hypothetical protein
MDMQLAISRLCDVTCLFTEETLHLLKGNVYCATAVQTN